MNQQVSFAAMNLRMAIEGRADGDLTGPAVQELVYALGGNPNLLPEFVGKPALTAAYLVALVLTQPE
jgi:hypothetical protein